MKIHRITQASDPLYPKALQLYSISFPPHEQRESASQARILANPAYHFDVICDNGEFIGEFCIGILAAHFTLSISVFCLPCGTSVTGRKF